MIVVVPGSCPWVMLPDGKLIVSFGFWLVSFFPNTGFVVSLVCAVGWPGYFGKETSPRGRDLGLGLPTCLANRSLWCLQVPMGKMETWFSSLVLVWKTYLCTTYLCTISLYDFFNYSEFGFNLWIYAYCYLRVMYLFLLMFIPFICYITIFRRHSDLI